MKACNAFVVAAGFGERLKPLTTHIPKPLLPVAGEPAIELVLERIISPSIKQIGVNIHYKREQMEAWAVRSRFSDRITFFKEDRLLGTGGALKNAASMLEEAPFLVHNADILSNIDLKLLVDSHFAAENLVTLAIHDFPPCNNVWLSADGNLKYVGRNAPEGVSGLRPVAFTGIAVYSPEFLQFLPEGESCVVDGWLRAISCGHRISVFDASGCYWTDIGSPAAYAGAVRHALNCAGEQFYVAPSVACAGGTRFEDWAALEAGCIIHANTSIRRSVVLPGAVIAEGTVLQDVIAGPGFYVDLRSPASQTNAHNTYNSLFYNDFIGINPDISLIGFGGSDRAYYRVRSSGRTAVLLKTGAGDPDYIRQIELTRFLQKYGLPVPVLLAAEPGRGEAAIEDLGDISLYVWLKCHREAAAIEAVYQKILDMLITLHTRATEHIAECPTLETRLFNYEHLRWESSYFLEHFVKGLKGIEPSPSITAGLLQEFHHLAAQVDVFRKTIVHRDFQSQNIMIQSDNTPRLIDYQGARIGPPAYDVISMLRDPYRPLAHEMQRRLTSYYLEGMQAYSGAPWSAEELLPTLLPCSLQRHMQALGAYAFLSRVKGKTYFLQHVPQALKFLTQESETAIAEYPYLAQLLQLIHGKA